MILLGILDVPEFRVVHLRTLILSRRILLILQILQLKNIDTQQKLVQELRAHGNLATQATVSRDIKELRLIKISGRRTAYCYAKPGRHETPVNDRMIRLLSDSVVSIDYAGQMIVVKTLSGSANVAAEAIDNMNWEEVLGTIAGDNTIFVAVRNEIDARIISERIKLLIEKE